jgi:hypothetical protein
MNRSDQMLPANGNRKKAAFFAASIDVVKRRLGHFNCSPP